MGVDLRLARRRARDRVGSISLSSASHFPTIPSSYSIIPVRFPPGRARLATSPEPTGSDTLAKTIGMAPLSRRKAVAAGVEYASRTSGWSATSSRAWGGGRTGVPPPQRGCNPPLAPPLPPHRPRPPPGAPLPPPRPPPALVPPAPPPPRP